MLKEVVEAFLELRKAEDEQYVAVDDVDNRRYVLAVKSVHTDVCVAAVYYDEYEMHVKLYDCRCGLPEEMKTAVRKAIFEIAKQFAGNYV